MLRKLYLIILFAVVLLSFPACSVRKYSAVPKERLSPQAESLLRKEGLLLTGWLKDKDISPVLTKYLRGKDSRIHVRPFGEAEVIMGLITLGVFPVGHYNSIEVAYCDEKKTMKYEEGIGWWFASVVWLFPGWIWSDFKSEYEMDLKERSHRTAAIIGLINELAQTGYKNCAPE